MKAPQPQPLPATPKQRSAKKDTVSLGPSHNFSKMPNEYAYLLEGHKLAGTLQRDIIFCILHHTWGAYPQKEQARLSTRQIGKYCDDAGSSNVGKATADLMSRGIIDIQESKGCTRTAKNYKLTPERWKDAPPYEPPELQQSAADPDEQEDEDEDDPVYPGTPNCSKLLIRPGCKPRPVAARLAPKDKDPVDFRIECSNTGFDPVEFSATTDADVLRISFQSKRRKSETVKSAEGEDKPKEKRTNGIPSAIPQSHPSPSVRHSVTENKQSSEFELAVKALLADEFDKPFELSLPADQKFLESILSAAGPDVPAAIFVPYARRELFLIRSRRRKQIGSGILIALAGQCAQWFKSVPRPSEPSPTPTSAADPVLASAEDISELLELCIICGGDGEGKMRGVATGKPCGPCNGTGRNPSAGGRPC